MSGRLGVVGSCNVDLVVRCRQLPRAGETVLGDDVVRFAGGKGANQAVAMARLGGDVVFVGSLGLDEFGDFSLEALSRSGVDVSMVRRSSRPTGAAFITVDDAGENEIVVSSGANADLSLDGVAVEEFDVVLAQLEVPLAVIEELALRARSLVLNVAPMRSVAPETLARCSVIIANEVEAEPLVLAPLAHVVVTMGARGAVRYEYGRQVDRVGAPTVRVTDTVGAGDAFCAAYAWCYAEDRDDALAFAVTAGALATTAAGARGALANEEEVREWMSRA